MRIPAWLRPFLPGAARDRQGVRDTLAFLESLFPDGPTSRFKLLILHVLSGSPHPYEQIVEHLRAVWRDEELIGELLRGDVTDHVSWAHVAGLLEYCHTTAEHVTAAHELFDSVHARGLVAERKARASAVSAEPPAEGRPDPAGARTEAELLALMRGYRIWAGRPSYEVMASEVEGRYVKSTLSKADKGPSLPTFNVYTAYLEGCGARGEELEGWRDAWRTVMRRAEGESRN